MPPSHLGLVALSLLAACSSSSDDREGFSSSSGGSGSSSGKACDPLPGSDQEPSASSSSSSSGGPQSGTVSGTIDLDGGSAGPIGARTPCVYNGGSGAQTVTNCTDQGDIICCEKKGVCYEPASEPDFCDRPYCE